MKKISIIITISIVIIILIMTSVIVYAKDSNSKPTLNDKVSDEIDYLDKYLISLLGKFNGLYVGEYSNKKKSSSIQIESEQENNLKKNPQQSEQRTNNNDEQNKVLDNKGNYEAKWDEIDKQIEEIYETWNTISIDLHSLNIDSSSILAFSDALNQATIQIKDKKKIRGMEETIKMYQLLPKYSQSYRPDSMETNLLKIKSDIVTSYVNVSGDNWQDAQKQLSSAEKQFTSLLNSINSSFQNKIAVNQSYILVNELAKIAKLEDKDIFFIEYQNLIGKMKII